MKNLVNFVLGNKLAVWLLTIIITVSGIYSGTRMNMETIPNISIPYLMVMDVYPGATPEKVMEDVSIPIEKAVEGWKTLNMSIQIPTPICRVSRSSMSMVSIWMKPNGPYNRHWIW